MVAKLHSISLVMSGVVPSNRALYLAKCLTCVCVKIIYAGAEHVDAEDHCS